MIPKSQAFTYFPGRSINLTIPEALNFSLAGLHISLNLFQFFILPLYLLPKSLWWSVVLVPIAFSNNPLWALLHEAIHDLFNSSGRINLVFGRVLAIFFGSPFHILRLTHYPITSLIGHLRRKEPRYTIREKFQKPKPISDTSSTSFAGFTY
jgi:hypothetical protein